MSRAGFPFHRVGRSSEAIDYLARKHPDWETAEQFSRERLNGLRYLTWVIAIEEYLYDERSLPRCL
jgi:hypothetical protein